MSERGGMDGGGAGTGSEPAGTNGGPAGTSGFGANTLRTMLLLLFLAYGILQSLANVSSTLADHERLGRRVIDSDIWIYELSSLFGWAVMIAVIWWAVRVVRPPRLSLPVALLAHAALTVPVSLGHVGLMVAVRHAAFALQDRAYVFSTQFPGEYLYEYRKDAASYVIFAIVCLLIQWTVSRYAAEPRADDAATIEVADGSVRHHVPVDEIAYVEAAGNYVEIAWRDRTLLHRATLSAIERELAGHGFARIHRSRLVRQSAIRRMDTHQSGDFEVTLDDGTKLRGSRRYRDRLD